MEDSDQVKKQCLVAYTAHENRPGLRSYSLLSFFLVYSSVCCADGGKYFHKRMLGDNGISGFLVET